MEEQTNSPRESKPKTEAFVREKGRGNVKAVVSGDTITVIQLDKTQKGPPVERTITLANIEAPKVGRRKTEKAAAVPDEPFAWPSREFLRKLIVGAQINYVIEYRTPKGKEFGTVQYTDASGAQEDLAKAVVKAGWAKVQRRPGRDPKPEVEELLKLEEAAAAAQLGVHSTEKGLVRQSSEPDYADLFARLKGKPQSGVVESVRNGALLRISLQPDLQEVLVFLSGVKCPEVRPDGSYVEPFGREARFFTEHFYLNRDVQLVLEGADKTALYGTVSFNSKNAAEELLAAGLATYVEWSGAKSAFAEKLKAAERAARQKKLRLWSLEQAAPAPVNGAAPAAKGGKGATAPAAAGKGTVAPAKGVPKELVGTVVDVQSGGTIVVQDLNGAARHKVNLSSVKVPRMPPQAAVAEDEEGKPKKEEDPAKKKERDLERYAAFEAREYVRRRLIGQRVRCVLDYSRAAAPPKGAAANGKAPAANEPDRNFFSVYLDKNNIAVELCEAGWGEAQPHRAGEDRSKDYEFIMLAESRARKANKGMFQTAVPAVQNVDLTRQESKRVKELIKSQYLPALQRGGRVRGVVDYEFSSTKLKIFVPKHNCYIALSLSAVRGPLRTEPLADASKDFAVSLVHQRDVEFDVEGLDKAGNFIGNLWISGGQKKNLATALLEQGLVKTYGASESDHGTEYVIAEDAAKKAKKNLWQSYDEAAVEEARRRRQEEQQASRKPKQELVDVTVTEIIDGGNFYVQIVGAESQQLEDLMKKLSEEDATESYTPTVNEMVKARFTEDDTWYRAVVKAKEGEEYKVFYVDYGNSENLPATRLRKLDQSLRQLAPQAHQARLAYIRAPALTADYGEEAAHYLKDLVWGKTIMANIEFRDRDTGVLQLSLGDRESQVHVNAAMLRAGLARVERVRGGHDLINKLREEEAKAKANHLNLWQYGDAGSDEDDGGMPRDKSKLAAASGKAPAAGAKK